jgi:ABC-type multidrug transport system ATPase subunit
VGLDTLDSGNAIVNCKIKHYGYLPQGVALFEHFTIAETFTYFGKLYGMNTEQILTRKNELDDLFELPALDRIITNLRYQ